MIVGQTGSGKTTIWKTLQATLSKMKKDGEAGYNLVKVISDMINYKIVKLYNRIVILILWLIFSLNSLNSLNSLFSLNFFIKFFHHWLLVTNSNWYSSCRNFLSIRRLCLLVNCMESLIWILMSGPMAYYQVSWDTRVLVSHVVNLNILIFRSFLFLVDFIS